MIELKSTLILILKSAITLQKNFETNNFFEKLNIFYTDTDIFMEYIYFIELQMVLALI